MLRHMSPGSPTLCLNQLSYLPPSTSDLCLGKSWFPWHQENVTEWDNWVLVPSLPLEQHSKDTMSGTHPDMMFDVARTQRPKQQLQVSPKCMRLYDTTWRGQRVKRSLHKDSLQSANTDQLVTKNPYHTHIHEHIYTHVMSCERSCDRSCDQDM